MQEIVPGNGRQESRMSANTTFEQLREILLNSAARVQRGNVTFLSDRQDRSVPEQFDHTRCGEFDDELSPTRAREWAFPSTDPGPPRSSQCPSRCSVRWPFWGTRSVRAGPTRSGCWGSYRS